MTEKENETEISKDVKKKNGAVEDIGPADEETVEIEQKRYVMLEVSCGEGCVPCVYPNCPRFAREKPVGKPMESWVFEIDADKWKELHSTGEEYKIDLSPTNSVLVIGGGIAGIQASLDLADMGKKVYLVEKAPTIGGNMAKLDKTFPTNDCSICILAPKMAECYTHPNIDVITYSEVEKLEGNVGNFRAQVRRKARYVDEMKCTGCLECVEKCPTKLPSEFDEGLGQRKAIYLPFKQALPRVVTIDPEHCLMITKNVCGVCQKVCQRGAIDYTMKDEILNLNVGSIIVATGFEVWNPSEAKEYGYGKYPNVYTSMEYERLINAAGPTGGELIRRSDGQHPKRIAWIQCVGSRNVQLGHPYCCSVCCTLSAKEAMLAGEHIEGEPETYIFYKDIRTFGKGFYEYQQRAVNQYGVHYIDSDATVQENPENHNPIVVYDVAGKPAKLEVDMVVLSVAMVPRKDTKALADILGVELNEYGYYKSKNLIYGAMETNREGIFLAGYCREPMDIPESVTSGSATAAKVSEVLREVTA